LSASNSSKVRGQSDPSSREKLRIGQHLATGLATGAVVGFVFVIANALDGIAASWARLAIAAMHSHVFTERRHFFGKVFCCFAPQLIYPVLKC